MDIFNSIISNKYVWLTVFLFILGVILMYIIETLITTKNTYYPILGLIPSIGIWYIYIVKPFVNDRNKLE